jgi:hypothetical protein
MRKFDTLDKYNVFQVRKSKYAIKNCQPWTQKNFTISFNISTWPSTVWDVWHQLFLSFTVLFSTNDPQNPIAARIGLYPCHYQDSAEDNVSWPYISVTNSSWKFKIERLKCSEIEAVFILAEINCASV